MKDDVVWKVGDNIKLLYPWAELATRDNCYPISETGPVRVEEAGYQHGMQQTVRVCGRWCWSYHFELAGGPW